MYSYVCIMSVLGGWMGSWQQLYMLYHVSTTFFSQTHKQVGKLQFHGLEIYLKKDCILISMDNPYVPTVGNIKFLFVMLILKKAVRGKGY